MKFSGRKESRLVEGKNVKIAESYYFGADYTRDMIRQEVERLQRRYPEKQFQVAVLYEKPMSGNRFSSIDPVHLFTLLEHYDESQMPDPEDRPLDPETYDRFWVYINNPITLAGGCSAKNNNGLNDCLYICLLFSYVMKWKLPQAIKTPEMLKKRLRLQRSDPVLVSLIEEVEIASSICINITGDYHYQSSKNFKRKINLVLANRHYSLVRNPDRKCTKWYSNS